MKKLSCIFISCLVWILLVIVSVLVCELEYESCVVKELVSGFIQDSLIFGLYMGLSK